MLAVIVICCFCALIVTPVIREGALALGLVDRPDGLRKLHQRPVPRVGGIAIGISLSAGIGLFWWLGGAPVGISFTFFAECILAGAIILATGIADDLAGLLPWQKLLGQSAASLIIWHAGLRVTVAGESPSSVWLSIPLTILWLLLCVNGFNLIDGLDGLAAGTGLVVSLVFLGAAIQFGNSNLAQATAPLTGCLIGFLRYNLRSASIFLGDSGSLLIGFVVGCLALVWAKDASTPMGSLAPAMALAIPVADVSLAIVRRFLTRRPIFQGDYGHIHHRLLQRGLSPFQAVLSIYAAGAVVGLMAILCAQKEPGTALIPLTLFVTAMFLSIRFLGYREFDVLSDLLRKGTIRSLVSTRLVLDAFQSELSAFDSVEAAWPAICRMAKHLGFESIWLQSDSINRSEHLNNSSVDGHWELIVPLPRSGRIELRCAFATPAERATAAEFASVLGRVLALRADGFGTVENLRVPVSPRLAVSAR